MLKKQPLRANEYDFALSRLPFTVATKGPAFKTVFSQPRWLVSVKIERERVPGFWSNITKTKRADLFESSTQADKYVFPVMTLVLFLPGGRDVAISALRLAFMVIVDQVGVDKDMFYAPGV